MLIKSSDKLFDKKIPTINSQIQNGVSFEDQNEDKEYV
jgi:hypothetical protein